MPSFLLEVGTEELPAAFVADALRQWRSRIPKSLADLQLTPSSIEFYGTPRRLAVLVKGLPVQQADQDEEVKGPSVAAAFKEGEPTKAALGFAQKQGVKVADFEVRSTEKGDFIFIKKLSSLFCSFRRQRRRAHLNSLDTVTAPRSNKLRLIVFCLLYIFIILLIAC